MLCLTLALNSEVGRAETTVHGSLSIGFEHDTNVAVDELDRSSKHSCEADESEGVHPNALLLLDTHVMNQ